MDERSVPAIPPEQPRAGSSPGPGAWAGAALDDPRALTILTTEHWSLLSARSLVYNEAFARAGMFLTFLSASLVALGLLSTGARLGNDILLIAAVVLGVDLFVGVATMGRVASATSEDMRYLQGMNRLRHAYHELVPGLEPYFIAGKHDDMRGVFAVYGAPPTTAPLPSMLHGFTTVPGMVGVVNAAVAGVLAAVLVELLGAPIMVAVIAGVVVLLAGVALSIATMVRSVQTFGATMAPRFPTPD